MTIKDIAQKAGVSITTVSKILNGGDQHISHETRSRVLQVIEENNYVTNSVARGLKTKKTNTIGFVLPDIVNPYYTEIARGIEDVARQRGFGVIFCNTDNQPENEKQTLAFLKSKMVDGIVYTRSLKGFDSADIQNVGIPVVVVDRAVDIQGIASIGQVYVDVTSAIRDATHLLYDSGCRSIAMISSTYTTRQDRYFGYVDALQQLGLPLDKGRVYLDEFDVETGNTGIRTLLEKGAEIDGVVCGNDLIAIGVLGALRDKGIQVPGDIKVIGLDNIYLAGFTNPRLSTMAQPIRELGSASATMLIDYILQAGPMEVKMLDYTYIPRESV